MSIEEKAFSDALAANDNAVEAIKADKLRFIATAIVKTVRQNASVDWIHRELVRAHMRKVEKRLLREFGYPPDLASDAVKRFLPRQRASPSVQPSRRVSTMVALRSVCVTFLPDTLRA